MVIHLLVLLILLLFALPAAASAPILVVEVVDDLSDDPVEDVEVTVAPGDAKGAPTVTSYTDGRGITRLSLEPGRWTLLLRQGAFAHTTHRLRMTPESDTLRIRLRRIAYHLPERLAMAVAAPSPPGVTALAPVELQRYPAPTADPARIVRILPGVASAGDQSPSSFYVRGGSFDENLLYIEGVEIEAPLMLRNGLGETMSLINSDLVGDMHFHAGVLPVDLGDRLSSALDVGYRRPDSLQIGLRAGTQRQAATISARHGRLSWIVGARHADLTRLTKDLQTSGEITPDFGDVQGLAAWRGERVDGSLFAASARSGLALAPDTRHLRNKCTDFRPSRGEVRRCGLIGEAEGLEQFEYDIDVLGARLSTPLARWRMTTRGSMVRREEREDTDLSFFADWNPSSTFAASSPNWLQQHDVADGRLRQTRWEGSVALSPSVGDSWEVGAGAQRTQLDASRTAADTLWLDGRSLPADRTDIEVDRDPVNRFGYLRTRWQPGAWWTQWETRALHVGESDEWMLLPRLRLGWQHGDWRWTSAAGLAAQAPHYKEFLAAGDQTPLAQKGADGFIEVEHQRPRWRLRGTLFARRGWDRISWTIDDVEIRYAPINDSRTRAWGAEWMLRGQVGRAVGLVSYSLLHSQENLEGDGLGWVPTASDQRHTATVFLEDQMNLRVGWMQASRFHIRLLYGSGFPYTSLEPVVDAEGQILRLVEGERHALRDDPYIRFDMGLTQVFRVAGIEVEIREEVANLFDEFNAVGFRQLPAPDGTMALLPRGLGRRVFNGEVSVLF
ncbi:MAG: TonB-dependent receptor [Gemmatimonadetes bacterium]|nr:TonB-dependent receptor [Gemmatimonadota bacterium]MBT7859102.1 TonB-dependent receptor [Gemmatimonadota bacterium]